jgi:hypothetical protein
MHDRQVTDGAGISLPLRKGRPGHPDVVVTGNQMDEPFIAFPQCAWPVQSATGLAGRDHVSGGQVAEKQGRSTRA